PVFEEPGESPRSRPELAERFPLILTCTKSLWFCETQHRNVASLRTRMPDPQVELHPETARARGVAAGDWVRLETPHGGVRARAKFNSSLDPQVVCGQHGWWQSVRRARPPRLPAVRPGQR
ncbi:MAG: molybdopterin oxidoreductase, partial [Gammaproteobacteria bacterium]|nr:molybdopterin oxidoreductase [Gemmatimonadota bacterium]NIT66994.1 molybdopterin oxidoreductase [Gemmatimonadota bacterium]NIU76579.1 molybdopterin oxidoreductase [Gammaproteobacteria bacterium]NIW75674.1 molybdopterin oxidoreductase [Gemmatimonadota bacterium]NIY35571.1 molybdopterin oxidoreductase [Gemmatimonadota bacterium]